MAVMSLETYYLYFTSFALMLHAMVQTNSSRHRRFMLLSLYRTTFKKIFFRLFVGILSHSQALSNAIKIAVFLLRVSFAVTENLELLEKS